MDFHFIQVGEKWRVVRMVNGQVEEIFESDEIRPALKLLLQHVAPDLTLTKRRKR